MIIWSYDHVVIWQHYHMILFCIRRKASDDEKRIIMNVITMEVMEKVEEASGSDEKAAAAKAEKPSIDISFAKFGTIADPFDPFTKCTVQATFGDRTQEIPLDLAEEFKQNGHTLPPLKNQFVCTGLEVTNLAASPKPKGTKTKDKDPSKVFISQALSSNYVSWFELPWDQMIVGVYAHMIIW